MVGFKSFLFLLILNVFVFVEGEKEENCIYFDDHKRLGKCYEDYMQLFNISHNEISYEKYIEKTNDFFKSLKSAQKLCQSFQSLKQCIGNRIIKNCINLEDFEYIFMNLDHKKMEHLQYVINFNQFNYICGEGFEGYKKSFTCINKMKVYCSGYGSTCEEAKTGIACSAIKTEKECGKNGFEYIKNIFEIGLCYSRPDCGKEFCKHEKIRKIRDTVSEASDTKSFVVVISGIVFLGFIDFL